MKDDPTNNEDEKPKHQAMNDTYYANLLRTKMTEEQRKVYDEEIVTGIHSVNATKTLSKDPVRSATKRRLAEAKRKEKK